MHMPMTTGSGLSPVAATALLAALLAAPPAAAAPALVPARPGGGSAPMEAHKAFYDLSLASTHGGGTVAASGSMSFGVTDACTGWASQQELRLRLVTREGQASDMVSDYATLESKDGRHLTFDMQQRDDGRLTQQVRGEATLDADGDGGVIHFTLPARTTMALPPGTLFPMAHTAAIIEAARAGRRSIDPVLFDGTSADGPTDSYVTILGWRPAPSSSDFAALRAQGAGEVHVAFFARKPDAVTPDYEIGMRYFDGGVSDRLEMDFGDFTMHGTLTRFTPAKAPARC